jgi:hypothetical protein
MEGGDVIHIGRVDFRNDDRLFGIKHEDRFSHVYVIGKTGTGKSTCDGITGHQRGGHLAADKMSRPRQSLICVITVGPDARSIYRFRARPSCLVWEGVRLLMLRAK